MDLSMIASLLPTRPDPAMRTAVLREHRRDELGGDLLIFRRGSWSPDDDGGGPQWLEDPVPRQWAAECVCTACGDRWWSGWIPASGRGDQREDQRRGIRLPEGPDGTLFQGVPDEDDLRAGGYAEVREGETVLCPSCGAGTVVTHRSDLHRGRLWQVLASSIVTIPTVSGRYAAVLWWMCWRVIGPDGDMREGMAPFAAAVLDERGRPRTFRWGGRWEGAAWRPAPRMADPEIIRYPCYGAIDGRKIGAVRAGTVPDLTGSTAKTTGLAEYAAQGGGDLFRYLRLWREIPEIEALVKAGWGRTVAKAVRADQLHAAASSGQDWIRGGRSGLLVSTAYQIADWEAGPRARDLLHMRRPEVRMGAAWDWDPDTLLLWLAFTSDQARPPLMGPGDAAEFDRHVRIWGLPLLRRWGDPERPYLHDCPLRELDRYLRKQCRISGMDPGSAVGLYLDYREMLWALAGEDADRRERWPVRLRDAHDALTRSSAAASGAGLDFAAVAERWVALEWSDGQICVRLPRSQDDLTREGRALAHCVGRYGPDHCKDRLILFVRHHRRPERSWYTLNEDVSGTAPRRVQLHGYGNEYVRETGKTLRIPRRVRDFVERWEDEILDPVFREVRARDLDAKRDRLRGIVGQVGQVG